MIRWRKPEVPSRPEYCWYRNEKKNGAKEIRPDMKNVPECQKISFPNVFDDKTQFCNPGDHNFCLGKDINMYCSEVRPSLASISTFTSGRCLILGLSTGRTGASVAAGRR